MKEKDEKGFLLIEVLIALLLLIIIIIGFTALITSSYQGIHTAGSRAQALYEAQELMENAIASPDFTSDEVVIVQLASPPGGIASRKITVTVPYTDAKGFSRTVTLTSYIPN